MPSASEDQTDIFIDMIEDPPFVHHLFEHITDTMMRLAKLIQQRQRETGFHIDLFSVSNCVVNMISSEMYETFILPCDLKLSREFARFGVHNCNWNIDPYIDSYRKIERMGYIDMGIESDMKRVRAVFPEARRAVLYSPLALEELPFDKIADDIQKIYEELAPCDIVLADVEKTASDERVRAFLELVNDVRDLNGNYSPAQ